MAQSKIYRVLRLSDKGVIDNMTVGENGISKILDQTSEYEHSISICFTGYGDQEKPNIVKQFIGGQLTVEYFQENDCMA